MKTLSYAIGGTLLAIFVALFIYLEARSNNGKQSDVSRLSRAADVVTQFPKRAAGRAKKAVTTRLNTQMAN